MIVSGGGTMGSGMTLCAVAMMYQQREEGKRVVFSPVVVTKKHKVLRVEELRKC